MFPHQLVCDRSVVIGEWRVLKAPRNTHPANARKELVPAFGHEEHAEVVRGLVKAHCQSSGVPHHVQPDLNEDVGSDVASVNKRSVVSIARRVVAREREGEREGERERET